LQLLAYYYSGVKHDCWKQFDRILEPAQQSLQIL
jgi:hypothetical protein